MPTKSQPSRKRESCDEDPIVPINPGQDRKLEIFSQNRAAQSRPPASEITLVPPAVVGGTPQPPDTLELTLSIRQAAGTSQVTVPPPMQPNNSLAVPTSRQLTPLAPQAPGQSDAAPTYSDIETFYLLKLMGALKPIIGSILPEMIPDSSEKLVRECSYAVAQNLMHRFGMVDADVCIMNNMNGVMFFTEQYVASRQRSQRRI